MPDWAQWRGQNHTHDGEWHFPAQPKWICGCGQVGGAVRLRGHSEFGGGVMVYSFTQISQYLACPRRYRHRYLDGWQEKDTRAGMLFGRAFERALAAYFLREDAAAVLFREWSACQNLGLQYGGSDSWDRMLEQGIMLLDRFCQ